MTTIRPPTHLPGPRAKRPTRATRASRALGVASLLALTTPAAAHAHGALRRAVPAGNARLTAAPRELRLTFTERVELAVARVALAGPGGAPVTLAPLATVRDSATVVVAAIRGALAAGPYTVTWQVAGRDGHPVRGRYTFTVLAGAAGLASAGTGGTTDAGRSAAAGGAVTEADPVGTARADPAGEAGATVTAPGQGPPPAAHHPPPTVPSTGPWTGDDESAFDAGSPPYVAVRWLTYAALVVVLGAAAFRTAVLGPLGRANTAAGAGWAGPGVAADAERRAAALGLWGAVALLAAALARLGAQSVAMHGVADAFDPARVGAMLRHTVWGWGWLLQVGGAALAALGFARARAQARVGRPPGGAWAAAATGAVVLAFTPALAGHAVATPRLGPLAVLSDGLHVVGAGGWLGSLLVLLAAGVPAAVARGPERRGPAVAALVHAFSPVALACAALVAVTGVVAAWLHVGHVAALWATDYGRVLLVKLGVLAAVAATGAYNWRRVRPALGDDVGTARIRRSATAELVVGTLVLLATAALVATPTPVDAAVDTAAADAGDDPANHAGTLHAGATRAP